MGNIESVDGQSEIKHHIMPLKVPMPDPTELEEKFAIVLVSHNFVNIKNTSLKGVFCRCSSQSIICYVCWEKI